MVITKLQAKPQTTIWGCLFLNYPARFLQFNKLEHFFVFLIMRFQQNPITISRFKPSLIILLLNFGSCKLYFFCFLSAHFILFITTSFFFLSLLCHSSYFQTLLLGVYDKDFKWYIIKTRTNSAILNNCMLENKNQHNSK